jgi:hypothetical protein
VSIDFTALASLATSLEDLTRRIGDLAAAGHDDDDERLDLLEVERQLQTTSRRLEKIVRRGRRG